MAENEAGQMGFLDHLEELRRTIFWVAGIAVVFAIGAWFFSEQIMDTLLRPVREAGQETLYFSAPMGGFMLRLKSSVVVGILLAFPLIMHRIYMFVLPGLLPREKRVVTPLLVATTGLFYVGVVFCYLVLLPLVIRFALGFATEYMQPWLTVDAYFSMAARLCLAFGLLFELPMVVFVLSWAGIVHPKTLLKGWRWALLSILCAAAVLTPPDVISQVLLAGPVMLLYIASVLISMLVRRKGEQAEEESGTDDDEPDPPQDPGGGPPPPQPDDPPQPRPASGARPRDQRDADDDVQSAD